MRLIRRLRYLVTRRRRGADLREEMRLHVELRAAANRDAGLDGPEADRAARLRFGSELRHAEEGADAWGFTGIDHAWQDLRHAVRHLAQRPIWATTIVLTLAIGIGANASVFALVNALLFAPVAGVNPDQLVWLSTQTMPSREVTNVSYPDFVALRDRATTLSGVMAYSPDMFSVGGRPATRVFGEVVSGGYFDVLGVNAALGRMLRPEDDRPGSAEVAVLSDVLWREHFAGNPSVVNATAAINGHPFVIVGVAPAGFVGAELGEDAEIWVPIAAQAEIQRGTAELLSQPDSDWLHVLGRRRDGVTLDRSRAELAGIAASLRPPGSASRRHTTVLVSPATGGISPSSRADVAPVLGLLSLVPLVVLLVACSNVGNVIMANNLARRREFAMRRAIGASRGRLVGQLLVEALLLAMAAAVAGFVVSSALTHLVGYLGEIPAGDLATVLGPNPRVVASTTMLAVATVLVFGLLPAMAATKLDLIATLKEGDRVATGRGRLRSGFVVVQVALSLTLLVAAGLFLQSLARSLRVDTGFESRGLASASFDLALQGYSSDRQAALARRAIDRAEAVPGVTSAGLTNMLPLSGTTRRIRVTTDGIPAVSSFYVSVSPRYLETMNTPLVAGRTFVEADAAGEPGVAIVNETLAARLWPNQTPLGKRLRREASGMSSLEVVGVVRQAKYGQLTESPQPAFFVPIAQDGSGPLTLVARTSRDVSELPRALGAVMAAIDPDLPVYRAEPMNITVRRIAGRQEAAVSLLGVLGALTLLLAAIGLYGVAAHSASVRVREVGIRMALGARVGDVLRLFVGDGLRLASIGVAVGLVLSAAASQLLSSFLFGLTAADATTFVAGAAVLTVVAAIATYLPARRAARLNPVAALRQL